ncbi:MAG: hypothetical protein ACXACR_05065 [Candidatus Hodarchaeales archaeon]|jgi:hypothetical protein
MIDKEPSHLDNFSKFALDLESKIGVPHTEIINRFSIFYQNEFEQVCRIMIPAEGVFPLLTFASQYYLIVAATNPLFPSVGKKSLPLNTIIFQNLILSIMKNFLRN